MSEDDKARKIERANSYRQMMEAWAWKDFQKFMEETRKTALETGINASKMEDVQVQRGIVKCIDSLNGEIGFILGDIE